MSKLGVLTTMLGAMNSIHPNLIDNVLSFETRQPKVVNEEIIKKAEEKRQRKLKKNQLTKNSH